MAKRILITGAASGFGRGTAIELARRGHTVLAGVEIAPQKTTLLLAAKEAGVELTVLLLDITNEADRRAAFKHQIDVLINNAGVMETGPVAEIPMELVRRNFEVNVFGTLAMTQGFARQMVDRSAGKILIVSSMGGLITVPLGAIYTATKHALESLAEGLKAELAGTGVEVCIANPGPFSTGFNDRGMEMMQRWFDPATTLSRPELFTSLDGVLDNQLDPQLMVDALVRLAEEDGSKYRTVVPAEIVPWLKAIQEKAWDAGSDDTLWVDP
jgi:short-subunit dehydrogenase